MFDHTHALVPIENWAYSAPALRMSGRQVDVGQFAESLIYYEYIHLNITTQPQLAEFLKWFIDRGQFADLLSLIKDGHIIFYDYAFSTMPVEKDGIYHLLNIQDEIQAEPDSFMRRVIYHPAVDKCFQNKHQKKSFYEAVEGNFIEVKASEFALPIKNSEEDFKDPGRNALILQAYIDDLYGIKNLRDIPTVKADVVNTPGSHQYRINWNVNFNDLSNLSGKNINMNEGTPLAAGTICNRLILSASQLGGDLYLNSPMSKLTGDKLFESSQSNKDTLGIIESLQETVEFPNVKKLINDDSISFTDVLSIRNKAKKFRLWLQEESDRDRDAIIAYHNEIGKKLAIKGPMTKILNILGVLGGAAIGHEMSGVPGSMIGAATASFTSQIASKLEKEWKPVVFGNWVKERIETLMAKKRKK